MRKLWLWFGLLGIAPALWAQVGGRGWQPDTLPGAIVSTLIFGLIGIALSILGFKLFDAVTPWNLEREICEKQNVAVAILCAGMVVGFCLVLAAAVL
jgi:uncharacterized membrane protein YjfL (UPF0719 family)